MSLIDSPRNCDGGQLRPVPCIDCWKRTFYTPTVKEIDRAYSIYQIERTMVEISLQDDPNIRLLLLILLRFRTYLAQLVAKQQHLLLHRLSSFACAQTVLPPLQLMACRCIQFLTQLVWRPYRHHKSTYGQCYVLGGEHGEFLHAWPLSTDHHVIASAITIQESTSPRL
jgi:hypothetical protein